MCGRYTIIHTAEEIAERFQVQVEKDIVQPSFNAAPTQQLPVITNQNSDMLSYFRWGLIPFWAKDASIGNKMINARAETLAEKPSFKKSLQSKRCLVVADGFYEWKKEKAKKQPYRITINNGELFAFAGLWDEWKDNDGKRVHTFTIITTSPNERVQPIHDRMPAILSRDEEEAWLSDSLSLQDALAMLDPYEPSAIHTYPVSSLVNSPAYNSADLVEPMNSK